MQKLNNIISLFDGMSGGQIALRELGLEYKNYYASETDKYAVKNTLHNFPKTIQLGDVVFLRYAMCWKPKIIEQAYNSTYLSAAIKNRLRKLRKLMNIKFDLVLGGSPCQGFSFAGRRHHFNKPRSKLFFEYVRILNQIRLKTRLYCF